MGKFRIHDWTDVVVPLIIVAAVALIIGLVGREIHIRTTCQPKGHSEIYMKWKTHTYSTYSNGRSTTHSVPYRDAVRDYYYLCKNGKTEVLTR